MQGHSISTIYIFRNSWWNTNTLTIHIGCTCIIHGLAMPRNYTYKTSRYSHKQRFPKKKNATKAMWVLYTVTMLLTRKHTPLSQGRAQWWLYSLLSQTYLLEAQPKTTSLSLHGLQSAGQTYDALYLHEAEIAPSNYILQQCDNS